MPRVRGFTLAQQRKRDREARGLMKAGYSESRAYAISTANIKREKRKHRRK